MGERESVLSDAGILTSAEVPEEECLAMKASLAIPCHNLKHIRKYNIDVLQYDFTA